MAFHLEDLFGEDDSYQNLRGIEELMGKLDGVIDAGHIGFRDAVRILFAVMWPNESPDTQDVRPQLAFYFTEHGNKPLIEKIPMAHVVDAGPILGIVLAQDPEKGDLTDDDENMIGAAIQIVLESGGLDVRIVDDHLVVRNAGGEERTVHKMDVDVEVGKFRQELDKELGPSHDPEDPWTRWMS